MMMIRMQSEYIGPKILHHLSVLIAIIGPAITHESMNLKICAIKALLSLMFEEEKVKYL